ncbi:MAG: HEAT repeat domain-containing protein [Microcoleaceae cyanobacterium]
MSNFLQQAKTAAQQQNWSLVNQYLQQFLWENKSNKTTSISQKEKIDFLENPDLDAVINLAIEVLENGEFQEKWEISKLFKQIGIPAIAPLIKIIKDEDIDLEERWFVARILSDFNREEVVEVLANIIVSSETEDLQEMAGDGLAILGADAVDLLTDLLAKSESRLLATKTLTKINDISTITPLLSVVKDKNNEVRIAAISALTNYCDSRIPMVLISALKDTEAKVRKEAVIGLAAYANLHQELGLVKLLQPLLWDMNFEVCQQAAIALGKIGTNAAATGLFELLKTATVPVVLKIDAVRALGWIETQEALEYLQRLLGYNFLVEEQIINEIITALGKINSPELQPKATDILIEFFTSSNPLLKSFPVKKSLALALGYLGDIRALDYLIQLLENEDKSVRLHCVAAMKQLAPEIAYQKLVSWSEQVTLSSQLKAGIATALAEWNN